MKTKLKLKIPFCLMLVVLFTSCSNRLSKSIEQHRKDLAIEFTSNKNDPLEESDLKNLDYFAVNETFRLKAAVRLVDEKDIIMNTVSGKQKTYIPYAICNFSLNQKPYELTIFQNRKLLKNPKYANHLFLPFYDATNGDESYGGGRYLDFQLEDIEDGYLIIDFNKSYNPWCAYSSGYNCTIPPSRNNLNIKIEAGEKMYLGEHKTR